MNKMVLGVLGTLALAASMAVSAPAQAGGVSVTIGGGHGTLYVHGWDDRGGWDRRWDRGRGRHWDGGWRGHGRGWGRPRHGRDCTVTVRRYHDGWSWVSERRRVCW